MFVESKSGDILYIGYSEFLRKRIKAHLNAKGNNDDLFQKLQQTKRFTDNLQIQQYLTNELILLIVFQKNVSEALFLEQELIDQFQKRCR